MEYCYFSYGACKIQHQDGSMRAKPAQPLVPFYRDSRPRVRAGRLARPLLSRQECNPGQSDITALPVRLFLNLPFCSLSPFLSADPASLACFEAVGFRFRLLAAPDPPTYRPHHRARARNPNPPAPHTVPIHAVLRRTPQRIHSQSSTTFCHHFPVLCQSSRTLVPFTPQLLPQSKQRPQRGHDSVRDETTSN
jgi:hypothetical protein